MSPIEDARLEFELHSDLMLRCLGRGGALTNPERAWAEVVATRAALEVIERLLHPIQPS